MSSAAGGNGALRVVVTCALGVVVTGALMVVGSGALMVIVISALTVVVSRLRWLSWMRRPTGDQAVPGSTPAEVGNILCGD